MLPSGLFTLMGGCGGRGARRTDHYFVFYLMVGGWDLMLTTDPVKHNDDFFFPYEESEVLDVDGVRLGPAMKRLLPYRHRMAILKGIHCDTLNHPQARFRMVTGQYKPPGNVITAPSVQTILAQHKGAAYELPNLSSDALRPATFRGDHPDLRLEPVRVSSVEQLQGLNNLKGDVSKVRREVEEALRARDALTSKRLSSSSPLAAEFEQYANLERALAASDYRERVADANSVVDGAKAAVAGQNRAGKQSRLAVEAIKQDLCPVVTVGSGEFDSHSRVEYNTHRPAVIRGMDAVADICAGLDAVSVGGGKTLLDMTTVVVTSEFSRAPTKNELGGKHHWSANSMLFIGKGVKPPRGNGPRIFGRVDDGLMALPINPENGSTKRGADLLDMNHGLATVLAMAGIDPAGPLNQEPVVDLIG